MPTPALRWLPLLLAGALPWAATAAASTGPGPRLAGERSPLCQQALALGQRAFASADPEMAPPAPDALPGQDAPGQPAPYRLQLASGAEGWLYTGAADEPLAPWRVYAVPAERGGHEDCQIRFRPGERTGAALLPPALRALEALLDLSMGQDADEGTYRPTADLRVAARQTWTNVALRPWALGTPYNKRAETDAGLAEWAAGSPEHRRLYGQIQAQLQPAQAALSRYFVHRFQRSPAEAAASAAFALDVALRSHYRFPSHDSQRLSRDTNAGPNPWRSKR